MARFCGAWMMLAAAGCGGQYVFTVPDSLAPAGGEAPVVVRLQRHEVYTLAVSVENAALRFHLDDGPARGAYTDALGYASLVATAPKKTGRHELRVLYSDANGVEAGAAGRVFVWDGSRRIVLVDVACLALDDDGGFEAALAMKDVAADAGVVYLTRHPVPEHEGLRKRLSDAGFPEGPILPWRRERLRVEAEKGLPKVVVDARLSVDLATIKRMFPGVSAGICREDDAARAFSHAGVRCAIVGADSEIDPEEAPHALHFASWQDLGRGRHTLHGE